ncbi:MAG: hypothetical protein J5496_06435 [Lachnospiraceae bacterium]|nr:hypothetical protein [Lachnospiraceae bacterium]
MIRRWEKKAEKKAARIVSLILVLSMLLSACGGGENVPSKSETKTPKTSEQSSAAPDVRTEVTEVVLSPEQTSVTTKDGITVELGEYVLDGEALLTVSRLAGEDHSEEGYKIDVYDIQLGDMHELGDYITIRIPYDAGYCKEGQDPAKCVGAKYKNEATGEWEDVLFEVDAEKQELVIYTDHLSQYGAFCVENEGRRNALITNVNDSRLKMDQAQTLDFASRIAAEDPTVRQELREFVSNASDVFFDWADRIDNAINIATLGEVPSWLSTEIPETNQTLFSALGYIATARSLMTIAAKETVGGGASKGEILNLIRDVGSKVTTYWANALTSAGSGALSVGMGGVLIIDKMLTAFAEEAKSTKLEDIGYVYHHYNEGFSATWAHKLMKPADWRKMLIEVIEKDPDDPEAAIRALEEGFRSYASDFFRLTGDQQWEVAADVPNVTVKRIPDFTAEEQEQMISEYVAYLKNRFMPAILKSVQVYFIRKTETAELAAMNKIKDFYNTKITIRLHEDVPKGGKSPYAGYRFRFAPLGEQAVKGNWQGTWNEQGEITDTSTLIGFMIAGYPHTVEFFKPGADMDKDEPEFTVPFVISMPSITVEVQSGLHGWIDPWKEYQLEDIGALYRIMRDELPTQIRVRPVVYYYDDEITGSDAASFVIDMTEGAVTEYSFSKFYDDTSQWNEDTLEKITLWFTGAPEDRDLMTVRCKKETDYVNVSRHTEQLSDECDIAKTLESLSWTVWDDSQINPRAFAVDAYEEEVGMLDGYSVLFVIEEIYIP